MSAGANWLVVGRPIYAAADPIDAAHKMHEAARSGL
jgi:orotidine-5'-phosphate decarboxylase